MLDVSTYGDAGPGAADGSTTTDVYPSLDGGVSVPWVRPESGSVQVTGEQVIIEYRQQGREHRVVYTVIGPGYLPISD